MIKNFYFFLACILVVLSGPQTAFAAFGVGAAYGLSSASQNGGNSTSASKSYTTYGALAELPIVPRASLLLGVMYTEMGGHQSLPLFDFDVKLPYYQIPAVIDLWLLNNFALGIGGYYGIPAANATENGTIAGVISTSTSDTFGNLKWKGDDYGLIAHARVKIPIAIIYISGDLMYEYGLENVSTAQGQTINNRSLMALIGVGIGI